MITPAPRVAAPGFFERLLLTLVMRRAIKKSVIEMAETTTLMRPRDDRHDIIVEQLEKLGQRLSMIERQLAQGPSPQKSGNGISGKLSVFYYDKSGRKDGVVLVEDVNAYIEHAHQSGVFDVVQKENGVFRSVQIPRQNVLYLTFRALGEEQSDIM